MAIQSENPEMAPVHLAVVLLDDNNSVTAGVLDSLRIRNFFTIKIIAIYL